MVLIVLNLQVTFNKHVTIYTIFLPSNQKTENLGRLSLDILLYLFEFRHKVQELLMKRNLVMHYYKKDQIGKGFSLFHQI